MDMLLLAVCMAVTVEGLVEYAKALIEHSDWRKLLVCFGALAVSVSLCLLCGADVFGYFGVRFAWTPTGGVLTGIFASRGANYLSDLVAKLHGGTNKE